MTQWQFRLRYTNLPWGEGGPDAEWRDVGTLKVLPLIDHNVLQFRRKPGRRRLRKEQRRGEGR